MSKDSLARYYKIKKTKTGFKKRLLKGIKIFLSEEEK